MLIMDAIVETYDAADFTLWPVAAPNSDRHLALSDQMSQPEVGTAMAVLTCYNHDDSDGHSPDTDAGIRRIQNLLNVDLVIAPGGILLQDTATGVMIAPGCCFGLESWRDWLGLMHGEEVWLGHGTTAHVERHRILVKAWPDTDPPARTPIELPLAELPDLLQTVHDKLNGFLALAEQWASRYAPALAPALIAKLNEDLNIETPLGNSQIRNPA
ncbi:hypothetical protein [Streptomyces sp. B3I8]|uniref:hypothetical protein n=1 Tax=Streptomyces sp. B3I8 TaxID=3042303 RepID=UPI0027873A4B|nr:hypothetical protein [Streptomyces sp. B3I8]MDQ0789811.1 hypothetical protein [Streptomyces sp. B3I8]